jgi:hypothetical protein
LLPASEITDEALSAIKDRAVESLGMIFNATKAGFSQESVERAMHAAKDLVVSEDISSRDIGFSFFNNVSGLLGEEMGDLFEDLVPLVLEHIVTCEKTRLGDDMDQEQVTSHILNTLRDNEDDDDEDEEENEERELEQMNFSTIVIDSKKAAIACIGALAARCPSSFFPYLKESLQTVMQETESYHIVIRADALSCLPHLFGCANHNHPLPAEFTTEMLRGILKLLEYHIIEDFDKQAAAKACIALCVLSDEKGLGVSVFEELTNDITDILTALLMQQTKSQMALLDEESLEEEEDHDNVLIDSACELVTEAAKQQVPSFIEKFHDIAVMLLAYAHESRPPADQAMAVGAFAEIIPHLPMDNPSNYQALVNKLLPNALRCLESAYEQMRRNSAFCVGIACFHMRDLLRDQFGQIVEALAPLCNRENEEIGQSTGADIDNALGAIARVLMADLEQQSLPLDEVLPVLLNGLPIENDDEEVSTVNNCLAQLLSSRGEEVEQGGMREPVLICIAMNLMQDALSSDEVKQEALNFIEEFATQEEKASICEQLGLPDEIF